MSNSPVQIIPPFYSRSKLLVSVRNAAEAANALSGGCEILDIKEPLRGSLGMANIDDMSSILNSRLPEHREIPVSAALGEVQDWTVSNEIPALPQELAFVKLGGAGLREHAGWYKPWLVVRRQFERQREGRLDWIAVAYADWSEAQAPSPDAVIDMATAEGFKGVLFDTYAKSGQGLRHWISSTELLRMANRIRCTGLMVALAGNVQIHDLPELSAVGADIIGIRGAACRGGRRQAEVCDHLVRSFKDALDGATASATRATHQPV